LAKKVLVILPFVLVVAISIPFMKKDAIGGGYNLGLGELSVSRSGLWILWNVVIKSCLGVFSIILLSSTTSFPQLIRGMERLGSPKIFTMLASFMYRYSFILVDEILRIKRARDSRCFGGRWFWQSKVVGHMVGTLFLRSYHRGERVYLAMLSRGYSGTMPGKTAGRFGLGEMLFLSVSPLLFFVRIYLR
jgi:cobalt/nickel transport system permease protein